MPRQFASTRHLPPRGTPRPEGLRFSSLGSFFQSVGYLNAAMPLSEGQPLFPLYRPTKLDVKDEQTSIIPGSLGASESTFRELWRNVTKRLMTGKNANSIALSPRFSCIN